MDRNPRSRKPAEEAPQASDKGQSRYKPLAPKAPKPISQGGNSSPAADVAPPYELTFLNISDPQQSKTREARKFVRTQVMRNFAKEKRRQKPPSESAANEQTLSSHPGAESLLSVQQLLSTAAANPSDVTMRQQEGSISHNRPLGRHQAGSLPLRSGLGASAGQYLPTPPDHLLDATPGPTATLGWIVPRWPVGDDTISNELIRHCYSPTFRASNPLYMISLLIRRSSAPRYPLSIDIDSHDRSEENASVSDRAQNLLFQLAQQSSALAHALLMISASDLALRQVNKVSNDHRVIHHKAKALSLLNEAIRDLAGIKYHFALATIAVLASHELVVGDYKAWTVHIMGFSRTIDMKGGIGALPQENLVRQLITWSDQIGALFMNIRPFFRASDVLDETNRVRTLYPRAINEGVDLESVPGADFQALRQNNLISQELFEVLEDVHMIAVIGVENLLKSVESRDAEGLIRLRDGILQRLTYLAPDTHGEDEEEATMEDCIRFAALLLALDRLFSPVLPSAYFQITHMVADRLAGDRGQKSLAEVGAGHERVMLWICFIGTTVSSNNPTTRDVFVHTAVLMCLQLFDGPEQLAHELEETLGSVMGTAEFFEGAEMGPFLADLHTGCANMAK